MNADRQVASGQDRSAPGSGSHLAEQQELLHVGRPNVGDRQELHRLIDEILDRGWLTNSGPVVEELEQRIADYLGVAHCVAMANGTVALEITTRALNLKGEVIIPAFTFVATAHALSWQGLRPVFADIDESSHCLDPEAVRRMITPATTGILGVHLWGRPAHVDELQEIADEHGLELMFDAAHAFGCSAGGRMVGSFGRAEVLSFHATKFFNTFEGGAVVTNDEELANKLRLMRNFGFDGLDNVIHPGTNGKMPEVSAAMGLVNMLSLERFIEVNRANYESYKEVADQHPNLRLVEYPETERCNYQYIVLELLVGDAAYRDHLISSLHSEGVRARRYFWPGVHRMEPYRSYDPHAHMMLPMTRKVADRIIVLPTGTSVSASKAGEIMETIAKKVSDQPHLAPSDAVDLRRASQVGVPR